MIDINETSLESLRNSYLVANTPMFIVRSFKSSSAVIELAKAHSAQSLSEEIERRSFIKPEKLNDFIIPLALLIALSLKHDRRILEKSASLDFTGHRWYRAVAKAVIQSFRASSTISLQIPHQHSFGSGIRDSASSSFFKLNAGVS